MAEERKGMTLNAMLAIAGIVGVAVLAALWLIAAYAFFGALVLGLIAAVVGFLVLYYGFGGMHPGATADAEAGHVAAAAPGGTAPEAASGATASGGKGGGIDSTGAGAGLESRATADPRKTQDPADPRGALAADVSRGMAAGPAQSAAAAPAAAEGDGSDDGSGTRPAALDAPRSGGADDLKQIKGVGPKLESLLHDLGIYHFDQIAAWGPAEVAWMDGNLKGFRGRVSRDDWVEQARVLAAGGETEFSKKVGKGGVY